MFSISPSIRRVSLPNNEQKLLHDHKKHIFDLNNENYYDNSGNLLKMASESDYIREFILLLVRNELEVQEILEHHFKQSPKQQKMLRFFRNLTQNDTINKAIKYNITDWLTQERILFNNDIKEDRLINVANEHPNNVIESTIDDYLIEYNQNGSINDRNYLALKQILIYYFENGNFKTNLSQITVRKVVKKKFASVLYKLYRDLKDGKLDVNYLKIAKHNISLFENTPFDEENYMRCTLYKYFTSNT